MYCDIIVINPFSLRLYPFLLFNVQRFSKLHFANLMMSKDRNDVFPA